jgi:lipoprotein YgeR
MLKIKYILIVLVIFPVISCTPSRNFTYKNEYSGTYYQKDLYSSRKKSFREDNKESDNNISQKINYWNSINENPVFDKNIPVNEKCIINKRYIVRTGDTLFRITKKFDISLDELIKVNNIKNNKIFAGMTLNISSDVDYNIHSKINKPSDNKKTLPVFNWPIRNIYNTEKDGLTGVKSIGIIITGKKNSPVFPSADGIVSRVGNMRGFGNYVILTHSNNYLTIYSYLKDIRVKKGDCIDDSHILALVEDNKLHFQISCSGNTEDPLKYLKKIKI